MANPEHMAKLREGVCAWNKWRRNNKTIWPDLSKACLAGADFTGADLVGADLAGAVLASADFTYGDLANADLSRTNLAGSVLREANLTGTVLSCRARIRRTAHQRLQIVFERCATLKIVAGPNGASQTGEGVCGFS
jgi:uncharacterized protein YjbI with pentapeptide repeats